MISLIFLPIVSSITGILLVLFLILDLKKKHFGSDKIRHFSEIIHKGAKKFLFEEYRVMSVVAVFLGIFIGFSLGYHVILTFLAGCFLSALAGYLGTSIATRVNGKVTYAATRGIKGALDIAFSGGAVMGIISTSLGVLGLFIVLYMAVISGFRGLELITCLTGYSLGDSLVAIFARIGGGIYTKSADVGADMVGKVEKGIPEDDPRNPGVIADNVGDNVGDINGMGSDVYQAFVDTIVSALVLSLALHMYEPDNLIHPSSIFPLLVASIGVLSSVLGILLAKLYLYMSLSPTPRGLMFTSIISTTLCGILGTTIISYQIYGDITYLIPIVTGLITGVLISIATDYYTGRSPVRLIALAGHSGTSTLIITGLAVGFESTVIPMLILVSDITISYWLGGLYGVTLSGVGFLTTLGIVLSLNAFGPIADNAGGIAEFSGTKEARKVTDALDSAGNTFAAIGRAFAVSVTAVAAISLLTAYSSVIHVQCLDLKKLNILSGMFLGGLMPPLLSSMALKAVGKAAMKIVGEIRDQFHRIPGLFQGEVEPDYDACIEIAEKEALKGMILPSLLALISPFIIAFLLGLEALAGFIAGSIVVGIIFALFMSATGSSWDNAKKLIESGFLGGKGTDPHKASVIADTVGDPLKDAAGPTLNILIELIAAVSLTFVPLFLSL